MRVLIELPIFFNCNIAYMQFMTWTVSWRSDREKDDKLLQKVPRNLDAVHKSAICSMFVWFWSHSTSYCPIMSTKHYYSCFHKNGKRDVLAHLVIFPLYVEAMPRLWLQPQHHHIAIDHWVMIVASCHL